MGDERSCDDAQRDSCRLPVVESADTTAARAAATRIRSGIEQRFTASGGRDLGDATTVLADLGYPGVTVRGGEAFAVRFGTTCLVGQWAGSPDRVALTVTGTLSDGTCL
ncbi:hypothetical protein GCM10010435_70960 [Winogradskya consettensis]|uniref:DUF6993 domain-containing protein n=1 Tax=Winogradskya consettensis TaxID=113560 RepID=A0A919VPL9_9ACTN|nr:hypothetical protein [Actinoplanes consettensis]GIM71277.1 hypothetical protein Aco04nite_24470 [Actinoplanes consettensis]